MPSLADVLATKRSEATKHEETGFRNDNEGLSANNLYTDIYHHIIYNFELAPVLHFLTIGKRSWFIRAGSYEAVRSINPGLHTRCHAYPALSEMCPLGRCPAGQVIQWLSM